MTKENDETHTGIYYNAYSEDLFVWDNDIDNDEANVQLTIISSNLNRLYDGLQESDILAKLKPYRVNFDFTFIRYSEIDLGIKSISFFPADKKYGDAPPIKISRGEERIFIWCFFLALMEVQGWAEKQSNHFFIDDPVTSLDDHNIFITASKLYELIDKYYPNGKIIISTHHVGIFAILSDWLRKGEKSDR